MHRWLNGGPGCSSFNCGVLMEISPVTQPQHAAGYCCLDSQPHFSYNEHTWTRATTVLLYVVVCLLVVIVVRVPAFVFLVVGF